jgi:PAS domain S-box-containing protein
MSIVNEKIKLNKITLSFPKETEKEFQKFFYHDSLKVFRLAFLLVTLLYGAFGILDTLIVKEYLQFFYLIRYAIVIPFLIIVFLLSYFKFFEKIWQILILSSFIIGGAGIIVMIATVPDEASYYGGLMLVIFAGYFFIKIRFIVATAGGWLLVLIFNIVMFTYSDTPRDLIISYNFFYIAANIISMLASYYIELFYRRNYLLTKTLNIKSEQLQLQNLNLDEQVKIRTHELEESKRILSVLFESMSDMVVMHDIVFDEDGKAVDYIITDCNTAYTNVTGIEKKQGINQLASKLYVSNPPPYLKEFTDVGITGKDIRFETYYESMDKYFLISAVPIGINKFATVTMDITEIKNAEEELKKKNRDFAFLNSLSFKLVALQPEEDIYELAVDEIYKHTGASFAIINEYISDKKCLEIKRFKSDYTILSIIKNIAGEKITQTKTFVSEEKYHWFLNEKIGITDNLVEVSFGAIPSIVDITIRKATGLKTFIGIAHNISGNLYGTTLLAFKSENVPLSREMLESYAQIVSLSIRRKRAEKELKYSLSLMKYIIEHTQSAVAIHDINLRFIYVSKRYLEENRISGQDIIGKNYYEVFTNIPEEWKNIHSKSLNGEVLAGEREKLVHRNGDIDWMRWECRPWYKDDESIGGIVVYTERISERILAEKAINELNESLEHKVIERTAELKDALHIIEEANIELSQLNDNLALETSKLLQLNEKLAVSENNLKVANQTKDKFFSIIAHDLRNPVAAIFMNIELMNVYLDRFDKEELKKNFSRLFETSKHLKELVENLLQWSGTQTQRFEFVPEYFKLNDLVSSVVRLQKINADHKKITLSNNISNYDLEIYADKNMLNTILRNLISNSIKFTPSGGTIEIDAINKKDKSNIEINVKDSGIGIPLAKLEKLFKNDDTFTTIGTSGEKGTGLGLMICKEFVEIHNGKIWIESEEGKGSTFYFTLPVKNF